jgi:acetoin utilization deacetylase AcuC-like enzyme
MDVRYSVHDFALAVHAHSIDQPDRILTALDALQGVGQDFSSGRAATFTDLARVHDRRYLTQLRQLSDGYDAPLDQELLVTETTWPAAVHAAGELLSHVDHARSGQRALRIALSRPGSHHASADFAMGFCVINNLAVAAAYAQAHGMTRVAIVDFDAHHGNGTEQIFAHTPDVLTASLHQYPFFPGTGPRSATDLHRGIINETLPAGAGHHDGVEACRRLLHTVETFSPQLILFEAGIDGHVGDPTSDLRFTARTFERFGIMIRQLADRTGCPMIFELGGGYRDSSLRDGLTALLTGLTA